MKQFESTGFWFLPNHRETPISGTVEFSQDLGLRLRLSGSFQRSLDIKNARYEIICGTVDDSPYGKAITLFDCFATNLRLGMPGAPVETIQANHGFAGTNFVESTAAVFDSVATFFSPLAEWLQISGLRFEQRLDGIGYVWQQPENLCCDVGGAELSTTFGFSIQGGPLAGPITMEEIPGLTLNSFGVVTAEEIHRRFVAPLSDLMTFVSDGRSTLDRLTLYKSAAGQVSPARFDRLYAPAVKCNGSNSKRRFLFTLADVKSRFEQFMRAWFGFVDRHPVFCSMFFSRGYEQHGFLENRFLFQVLAAESLIREESKDDPTLRTFEAMRQGFLSANALQNEPYAGLAFPSAFQIAIPALLGNLLNNHWPLISEVVGTTEVRFIETLFGTLDYVNSGTKRNHAVTDGPSLYWLLERLAAVLKICVLKRLEFTDEEIGGLVRRNAQMGHLMAEEAPWGPRAGGGG